MAKFEFDPTKDIPTQAKELTNEELLGEIIKRHDQIANLGVKVPFTSAVHAVTRYGHHYEDRRYPIGSSYPGRLRVTPHSLFLSYLHLQPELRRLETETFEDLAGEIGIMAMALDELLERNSGLEFPERLRRRQISEDF